MAALTYMSTYLTADRAGPTEGHALHPGTEAGLERGDAVRAPQRRLSCLLRAHPSHPVHLDVVPPLRHLPPHPRLLQPPVLSPQEVQSRRRARHRRDRQTDAADQRQVTRLRHRSHLHPRYRFFSVIIGSNSNAIIVAASRTEGIWLWLCTKVCN